MNTSREGITRARKLARPADIVLLNFGLVDAWITSAQQGAAWTLLYPAFGVVMPFPRNLAFPLVYPTLPGGDGAMKRFIDHWIGLKQRLGVFDAAYEYWILGQGSEEARPRWSVIRDVFGWID